MNMRRATMIVVCWCAGCLAAQGAEPTSPAPPTPLELLHRLLEYRDSVKTMHCITLWKDTIEGQEETWMKVTRDSDDLGRVRYFEEHGRFEGDQWTTDRRYCRLFDGELVLEQDYNYDVLKGEGQGDGKLVHCTISAAPTREVPGPGSMRKPFGFITSELIYVLEGALDRGEPIDISPVPGRAGEYFVASVVPPQGNTYRFTVDSSKNWLAVSEDVRDPNGNPLKQEQVTYRETPAGWLPSEGSLRKLVERVIPLPKQEIKLPRKEWHFECLEMSINAPDFSDDVFELVIPPYAYVYDSRFVVDYRVGKEGAAASDLQRLALEAQRSQAIDPSANPMQQALAEVVEADKPAPQIEPRPRSVHIWLLAANVAVLCTIAAAYVIYRRTGRNRSPTR